MGRVDFKNMFYFTDLNKIGGVESFFYYIAKKYDKYEIAVFYDTADQSQIERLSKYAIVKKNDGQIITTEKAFYNYGAKKIIDNVIAKEHTQIIHAMYSHQQALKNSLPLHPKINKVIGVSKVVCEDFEKLTGIKCELCYNPIVKEKPIKPLLIVSATRLSPEKRQRQYY